MALFYRKALVAAFAVLALAGSAAAQSAYPTRSIRFIIPFPPGGGNDILARAIATKMSASLGQPIVIDNRPGAGGNIGGDIVVQAPADGHAILLATNTLAINPHLQKSISFDVRTDLTSIARLASTPFVLAVPSTSPVASVAELLAAAREKPGRMTYASVGIGTPHHLGMELFKSLTGASLTHVPYKGSVAALSDLAAGEVQVMLVTINSAAPFMARNQIRVLGVGEKARLPALPQAPTLDEAGARGFEVTAWYGLMVRSGTPASIRTRLEDLTLDVIKDPQVSERLQAAGFEIAPAGAAEMQKILLNELETWGRVARNAGVTPE